MRFPERRKRVMSRSVALGHCVCNPKQSCPCEILIRQDLCPCAGERPDPPKEAIRLTDWARATGCASKISYADLQRVLERLPVDPNPNVLLGVSAGDDAGVYRLEGEWNLAQTVDVFSPVVDDPYLFGQICAANSVSDIYAMGGNPICALSIIGFPIEELPGEIMAEILRGGLESLREAGVAVLGGHSFKSEEIYCGFAVTGLIRGTGLANDAARPGDVLVLTKPVGTGLIAFARQIGHASDEAFAEIGRSMAVLNRDAAELLSEYGAHSCTDVTGFGLLGHLSIMARQSGVSARIDLAEVPVFAEAVACARAGIVPGAVERNSEAFSDGIITSGDGGDHWLALLYDAQTSGGLLAALPENRAEAYIKAMRQRGHTATSRIGEIAPKREYLVDVRLGEPKHCIGENRMKENNSTSVPVGTASPAPACCAEAGTESSVVASTVSKLAGAGETSPAAEAFKLYMKAANQPGRVDAKTKRLLSIALSLAQRCDPCMKIHIRAALSEGISREEIDEAAWLAVAFCGAPTKMFYEEIWRELEKA